MTERTRIEPISLDQVAAAYPALSDPRVYAFIPDDPPPNANALRQRWTRYLRGPSNVGEEQWFNWIVWLQDRDEVIGTLQATLFVHERRANLAYLFASAHWGQGLAAETVDAMRSWLGAEGGVTTCEAQVDTRNEASYRLLERLGFARVCLVRAADAFKGIISDEYLYRYIQRGRRS